VDGDADLIAPIPGHASIPVTLLPFGSLAAVIGTVDIDQLKDTAAAALVHEQVVETLMAERRVLPVRFGAVFSGVEALLAALATRHAVLCADLKRIDRQVEIGVRILWDGAAQRARAGEQVRAQTNPGVSENAGRPGIQYMRARMDEVAVARRLRQDAEALSHSCREWLAPFASTLKTKTLVTEEIPVSVACLVVRTAIESLIDAVSRFQAMRPDIRAVCTGPWPPYHFVTDSERDERWLT
jgi:hypothetical protein